MLSPSVKEAWKINTRINRLVLKHLTPEMVEAKTPGGGFSVAEHILEIVGTPKYFGTKFEATLGSLPDLYTKEGDDYIAETDLKRIREVAQQTADAVLKAAESAENKGDLPHASVDVYLIHMMVHDAHHRGQLFLALKNAGHPLPADDLVWLPWKEG